MANISQWRKKDNLENEGALRPLGTFRSDIESIFDNFFKGFNFPAIAESGSNLLNARMDIAETEKDYSLEVEIPGVEEKDIDISLSGDLLTVKGEKKSEEKKEDKNYLRIERSYGSFQRSVTLPPDIDADKVKANFKNGILTITIPKSENAKPSVKKIKVEG